MKVSRRAWHYKLYRYLRNCFEDGPAIPFRGHRHDYVPKSLCSYFWTTVFMMLAAPIAGMFLLVIAICLLVTAPFWWPAARRKARLDAAWASYKYGKGPRPERTFWGRKVQEEPRPNLFVAWIKAFKKRHCPLITLAD